MLEVLSTVAPMQMYTQLYTNHTLYVQTTSYIPRDLNVVLVQDVLYCIYIVHSIVYEQGYT